MKNPNYYKETVYGTITTVNADGTVSVKPGKCQYDYLYVPVPGGQSFQVGDSVVIGFYYNNRNMPFVLSKGSSNSTSTETVLVVSSLDWLKWNNALYRGRWNNTNQYPNISLSITALYTHPNPEGTAPTFGSSKIHDGYVYGTIYAGNMDNRLYRISLADGSIAYATWTGISMYRHPDDLMIVNEGGTYYAYIVFPWGYYYYTAKYNLSTFARTYISSEVMFNVDRSVFRRLFCDDSYNYSFWKENSSATKYQYIRKYNKSTGACVSYTLIPWPSFDYQSNNYGYLCYDSEIRSSINCIVGNGVAFPQMNNCSSSQIIYQVPAFNLVDATLKWTYAPTSKTLSRQYFSYVLEWYCSGKDTRYGFSFTNRYCTTNKFYYFTGASDGDKQIRNTLIACNDSYAVVLAEETTITQNDTYKSYDDWQQTVWKDAPWNNYKGTHVERNSTGQGEPGQNASHFTDVMGAVFAPFDSLALDEDYLPFQWIDRKEVFLRILDITTGELLTEYGFSASEEDTGGSDDLVISKDDLIISVRLCTAEVFVNRDKADGDTYEGPAFRDLMGLEDDEECQNCTVYVVTDYWEPQYTHPPDYEYYWCGCYTGIGQWSGAYWWVDEYGKAIQGDELGVQDQWPAESTPTHPGTWNYRCVAVKHPAADVTFHTEKYIPTKYDFSKSLITATKIIFAPSGADGQLGCFTITDPASKDWDCDVGPGSEYLHMLCNYGRIYYFRGSDRTNCTLYEINLSNGSIITTKTGVSVCSPTDGYYEPMAIDNKLILTDSKTLKYIGT